MPKYRVLRLDAPGSPGGREEIWELPWERLVFDQRLDYRPEGAEAELRFKVERIVRTRTGLLHHLAEDPGCPEGGDPKKPRP